MPAGDLRPAQLARGQRGAPRERGTRSLVAQQPHDLRRAAHATSPAGEGRAAPCAATSGKPPTAESSIGRSNASAVKSTPDWSISR